MTSPLHNSETQTNSSKQSKNFRFISFTYLTTNCPTISLKRLSYDLHFTASFAIKISHAKFTKWINDTVENVWSSKFKDCNIIHIENISVNLRLVRFETDLRDIQYEPAYAIGIRINDRDFRNYSPFNFNREAGTFEVLFHLHNDSAVGSHFAAHLSVGDSIKILIPRGKRFFEPEAKIHFSIGDETSLGSSLSIKEAVEEAGSLFICLHELEESQILESLNLYGYYSPKNSTMVIIEALTDFLREEKETIYNDDAIFYLTGNGDRMSLIRKYLKAKGVSPKCIKSQAYWLEGKKGL